MTFAFGLTVTVTRPARLASGGRPGGEPTTHTLAGVAVGPRYATEPDGRAREGVLEGIALYADYGADVKHTDLVTVDSGPYAGTWQVDGEPAHWLNPFTGWQAGSVIALKSAAG